MNKFIFSAIFLVANLYSLQAQTNPAIINWLINATGIQGSHYVQGNSTPINDNIDANVQSVQYSNDWAYITTHGIPAYTTGPFLDGNPSLASDQSAIYRFTLNPTENTGTSTSTTGGNIGNFINGVSLFDYRDGVAWNPTTSALCGGPGNPPCPGGPTSSQDWNRDAVPAEKGGFDCAKAHPAMGNYHHHQNPSAFDLDLVTVSTICDLYASDGLYNINPNNHSPLIGFAYDGFPIYGAYAYQNADGTGTIVRMQSGYELLTNTTRINGPNVNTTYFSGYFREDYQFVANTADDFLDEHNGRFCITPEYPNGIYCYFTTVDANWNSAYPYVVGPTFYGNVTSGKVTSINESVNTYVEDTTNTGLINKEELDFEIHIMPNPSSDFIAVQVDNLAQSDFEISLIDITGKLVKKSRLKQGSTVSYLDIQTVYAGAYIVVVSSDKGYSTRNVLIER